MRIGILTSGGDAPGMNAALRSAVRVAKGYGWTVFGINRGYQGLINGELEELGPRSVSNILQRGGTMLKTSRSAAFHTPEGLNKAKATLEAYQIDGLIVIGGNGTFRGAEELSNYWKGQIIGVPGTIDNDVWGTDKTIGFDTAVFTAVEALDHIRDTAEAHERFFLVEVMGRTSGYIALDVAIAGGAEEVLIPEVHHELRDICRRLCDGKIRGKTSSILVVAEGTQEGGAYNVAEQLKMMSGNEYRVVILGYLQRGGDPIPSDRLLGTKLGAHSINILRQGMTGVMVGQVDNKLLTTPFRDTWEKRKELDPTLLQLAPLLAL